MAFIVCLVSSSMAITEDWKIRSRSRECFHTQRPFEDGDPFFTAIFPDPETDGYLRRDYSAAAWEELHDGFEIPPFSYWRAIFKIPPPPVEKPQVIEKHSAESTLRRLIDEDLPTTIHARYILALMLERKRTLIQVDVKEVGGSRLLIYEHKATGDAFIIVDPRLKLDEIQKIQEEVADLLGSTPPPTPEEPTEKEAQTAEPSQATSPSDESATVEEDPGVSQKSTT